MPTRSACYGLTVLRTKPNGLPFACLTQFTFVVKSLPCLELKYRCLKGKTLHKIHLECFLKT
ncbi:MAG: hypothetical protein RML94_13875, partial [Bacteroidia bacterium]|nr:hypothetical protein [Bacteroidia bacterium]